MIASLADSEVSFLEVAEEGKRLAVAWRRAVVGRVLSQTPLEAREQEGGRTVLSPLAGTFYLRSTPGAEPFVREGHPVEKGQVVALVEAMKVFNEVKTPLDGRVVRILAAEGSPVRQDQPLMEIQEESL